MSTGIGLLFVAIELVFIALALLAILRTGFLRLNSSIGIGRDGFPPGKTVPSWSLPDIEGRLRVTPAGDHWQLLVFANHALASFPDLVSGMNHLAATSQELEVLLLSQDSLENCRDTVEELDLQVPVVPVDAAFYERFRVRVMPFVFFLDPAGVVRWVGLVNTEAQVVHAWQMAQIPLRLATPTEVR